MSARIASNAKGNDDVPPSTRCQQCHSFVCHGASCPNPLRDCHHCKRSFCGDCKPLRLCTNCNDYYCDCVSITSCDLCHGTFCEGCNEAIECELCHVRSCWNCRDGYELEHCPECERTMCSNCASSFSRCIECASRDAEDEEASTNSSDNDSDLEGGEAGGVSSDDE